MRDFKLSRLYCPIQKVKVKRRYYRVCLILAALAIWLAHEYHPHYEMHVAFLTNLLFALDPTV